jgi:predicted CXXCH cytochrome family protein
LRVPRSLGAVAALACGLLAVQMAWGQEGEYAGSTMCKMCHSKQAKAWATTKHAQVKPASDAPDVMWRYSIAGEPGVNCEACHGPNKVHQQAPLADKEKTVTVKPEDLDRMHQFALCARCHSTGTMPDGATYPDSYKPGGLLPDDYKLSTNPGDTPFRQWNDMQGSAHVTDPKGPTCITCHAPHSENAAPHMLVKPVNELCSGCHPQQKGMKHAKNAKPDSKCSDCHMPDGHHVFKAPAQ